MMTGRQLAHYLVGEKLGEGGMGVVYRGTDTRLKRPVALKFLTRALPSEDKERKRFLREARAASSINHPNVCVIHAIEEVEGEEFIVMEYVEGVTLRKWAHRVRETQKSKLLPVKDVLSIVRQVAEGLEAAHKKGIVHRDVKPENVMITAEGRAKIMDFGLAMLAGESRLTRTGATVGTVAYMSPEQVHGKAVDAQSDIYSLGVLIYELFAGKTPFQADHVMGMMYAIVNTEPEPLGKARPGIEPEVASLVMRCLEKRKQDRTAAMSEIIREINAYETARRTVVAGVGRAKVPGVPFLKRISDVLSTPKYAAWIGGAIIGLVALFVYLEVGENGTRQRQEETKAADSAGKAGVTALSREEKDPARDTARQETKTEEVKKDTVALAAGTGENNRETTEKKTKSGEKKTLAGTAKSVPEVTAPPVTLDLLTNRGAENPLFREGDTVRTYIRVNRPCTVRIFYHTADGAHYVLTGQHDLTVRRALVNSLIAIDSSVCSPPFGSETLQAFATTGRFEAIRTRMAEAGYYAITGDINAAMTASRGNLSDPGRGAVTERTVRITTASR